MKFNLAILLLVTFLNVDTYAQSYTSYFTGNTVDGAATATGGVCLMGGATEDDNAMRWFLERAGGGDILVLRASGSDGYNDYLYSELGTTVNSVETIVCNNASASNESYIHQKIQQAEGIWFAGGDQWDYVSYWRNTAIDSLINDAIANRNIVIGGTSAGMAILGGFYFSAENGTVTSSQALSNPYRTDVTVDSTSFIPTDYLTDVITDTHYDDPDRKGRHVVFLSRILTDYGVAAKGIACDEYTAVCIDSEGLARVYGEYPDSDDNAYFIQTNCELEDVNPEDCSPGNALNWNLGNAALKVHKVKGTYAGANTLDLNDWNTGVGGEWEDWYVDNGELNELAGDQPLCSSISVEEKDNTIEINIYPNPTDSHLLVKFDDALSLPRMIQIRNLIGQMIQEHNTRISKETIIDVSALSPGIYFVEASFENKKSLTKQFVVK